MNELAMERRLVYSTIHYLDYRPLMFETEPIEKEKLAIDTMINAADIFLGIYFSTSGNKNYHLNRMTPIEYELCYFIRKACLKRGGCKCSNDKQCLLNIRDILTQHFPNDLCQIELFQTRYISAECDHGEKKLFRKVNPENDTSGKEKIRENLNRCIENIKAAKKNIVIYCKYNSVEHAMSLQLLVLLRGLTNLGIVHVDFKDEWDLAKLVADNLSNRKKINKYSCNTLTKQKNNSHKFIVSSTHQNERHKLKAFLKAAFFIHCNIEELLCAPGSKESTKNRTIIAIITDYYNNTNDQLEIEKKFHEELKKIKKPENSTTVFKDNELPEVRPVKKQKFSINFEEIKEQLARKSRTIFFLRIIHLNVPGILYNVMKEITKWGFNIEWCLTTQRKNYDFSYTVMEMLDQQNSSSTLFTYEAEGAPTYKCKLNDKKQTTEIMISRKKQFKEETNEVVKLEISLSRIMGVLRAIVSSPVASTLSNH